MAGPGPVKATCVFCLPKGGNSTDEYEDASAQNRENGRFAIADGAAESSFADLWARLLVMGFVTEPVGIGTRWADWLAPLRLDWEAEVHAQWLEQRGVQPMPYHVENKFRQGAHATFLGLIVGDRPRRRITQSWRAIAVGDSCLFQVRGQRMCKAFPLKRSVDFNLSPALVGSRANARHVRHRGVRARGEWRAGDRFWLMTDALAQWFLRQVEAGARPWDVLEPFLSAGASSADDSPQTFADWIVALRLSKDLRNDDVTLLGIGM
jgi:hypothetical protein